MTRNHRSAFRHCYTPSAEMRAAMAAAEVGDDVYGEDPTVNLWSAALPKSSAARRRCLCPPAPWATRSPSACIRSRGRRSSPNRGRTSSTGRWPLLPSFPAAWCAPSTPSGGILTWKHIEPAIYARGAFRAATGLIEIENTANLAGGALHAGSRAGRDLGWRKRAQTPHASRWRAHLQCGRCAGQDVKALTRGFDTVMFCLSKGLGAPVGSMLVGSAEQMDSARLFRKALGGGMRQAGVLAAAGLMALEHGPKRLHQDHANARLLAETLANLDGVEIDLDAVETNIVIFKLKSGRKAAGPDCAAQSARDSDERRGSERGAAGDTSRCEPRRLYHGCGSVDRGDRGGVSEALAPCTPTEYTHPQRIIGAGYG